MKEVADTTQVVLLSIALSCLALSSASGQTYDAAWTFGNVDFSAYRLDTFEPAGANLGTVGAQNPTLALELRHSVTKFGLSTLAPIPLK